MAVSVAAAMTVVGEATGCGARAWVRAILRSRGWIPYPSSRGWIPESRGSIPKMQKQPPAALGHRGRATVHQCTRLEAHAGPAEARAIGRSAHAREAAHRTRHAESF